MNETEKNTMTETEKNDPWFRVPNYLDPTEEDLEEWEAKDAALTEEYFQYLDWKYGERKEKA